MKNLILTLVLINFFSFRSDAQVEKFGKLDQKVFKIKNYPVDTSAVAVILFDIGTSQIVYNEVMDGFQLIHERHTRIQILKKDGMELANEKIRLYKGSSTSNSDILDGLKGYTYNLVNGVPEKTKLEKDAIFKDKVTRNLEIMKFTMPNAKEGSIIEFNYKIISPYISHLKDWYFQRFEIPTLYSSYDVFYPDYFNYKLNQQGYEAPFLNKETRENSSLSSVASSVIHQTWIYKNIPGIKNEDFVSCIDDYRSKVEFQLATINFPGQLQKSYLDSWKDILNSLMEDEDLGSQLKSYSFLKDALKDIILPSDTDIQKIEKIVNYFKKQFKYNDQDGIYVTSSLRKAFESKGGSSVDINLLLTLMLREAGLKADPVLISTRGHGKVRTFSPMSNTFDYIISRVVLDGKNLLLDATNQYINFNQLPYDCLNETGLVAQKEKEEWVNIQPASGINTTIVTMLSMDTEGNFSYKFSSINKDYSSGYIKRNLSKASNETFVKETFMKGLDMYTLNEKTTEVIQKANEVQIKLEFNAMDSQNGDIVYIDPILFKTFDKNPLLEENRKYPVDYGYPISETYMFSFLVPEGYVIEELPKSINYILPDKSGSYNFMIASTANSIQLRSKFMINRTLYLPDEYPFLKDLYAQIAIKQKEQIVLRKVKK